MKYEVTIVEIGEMVEELLEQDMLILYDDNAPRDLADISVLHTISTLKEDVVVGDKLTIGEFEYKVTGVGNVANETLKDLGHCTLMFDASSEPNLPGMISLEGEKPNVKVGDKLIIY